MENTQTEGKTEGANFDALKFKAAIHGAAMALGCGTWKGPVV
jgi:hypothetical protein